MHSTVVPEIPPRKNGGGGLEQDRQAWQAVIVSVKDRVRFFSFSVWAGLG
jgi:hypothetical protein